MDKITLNETRLKKEVHHMKFSNSAMKLLKKSWLPFVGFLDTLYGPFQKLSNIGIIDGLEETTIQRIKLVNAINLMLGLLILTIGGMFCWISARTSVILPALLEFSSVFVVIYFNYKHKYATAAWLTYIGQFSAVIYFSLLLREILNLEAMVVWLLSIVFILFPEKRSRVNLNRIFAVSAAISTLIIIRVYSYHPPIFEPVEVSRTAVILFKESAFGGVVILLVFIGSYYVNSRDAQPKLNAKNKTQSIMVKTLSHELRNPYHQQYASAQMIIRCINLKLFDEAKYYAQLLIDSNRQAISFLDNVIELSRIEANERRAAKRELFSLPVLLAKYEQLCGPLAAQHHLKLEVETEFLPAAIYSDKDRIWHVMNNLVGNAINHAFPHTTIKVVGYISGANYVLEVINEGPTIPQSVLENIFDAFLTSEKRGGGLGLYLVRDAVTLMKGNIEMLSEDKLTRAKVSIPLEIGLAKDLKTDEELAKRECLDLSKVRVYVADDNKMNCVLLEKILHHYGCIVSSFSDGKQLLNAVMVSCPELIILDARMPNMDGYETLKILKDKSAYKHIPVIMATADSIQEDIEIAYQLGAMACMVKPFLLQDLEANIAEAVRLTMTTEMTC